MIRSLLIISALLFFLGNPFAQQDIERLPELELEELLDFDYSELESQSILNGIEIAEKMIASDDSLKSQKGTIIMAGMAYGLKQNIDSKRVDPKTTEWAEVLDRFRTQNYLVHQPRIHRFIKLSTYLCQGNYAHVLKRYRENRIFLPSMIVVFILIIIYLKTLFKRRRTKSERWFLKICHSGFVLLLILAIVFKLSCNSAVSQYSFYGIPF